MHSTLTVLRWPQQGRTVVTFAGEHDLATLHDLQAKLVEIAATDDILLDLTECTLVDASVLGQLAQLRSRCAAAGGELSGIGAAGIVAKALRITGFAELADAAELRVAS